MPRPLEQQFSASKVKRIRDIQNLYKSLRFRSGAAPYYNSEIVKCLEAGLLLAAMQVSTALLELFVRDLLIIVEYKKTSSNAPKVVDRTLAKIERDIEDGRPHLDFSKIVSELVQQKVISPKDREKISNLYRDVRIPLQHGITRRFIRISEKETNDNDTIDPLSIIALSHLGRYWSFEDVIEDKALVHLRIIGNFINKYLPVFNNLFSYSGFGLGQNPEKLD